MTNDDENDIPSFFFPSSFFPFLLLSAFFLSDFTRKLIIFTQKQMSTFFASVRQHLHITREHLDLSRPTRAALAGRLPNICHIFDRVCFTTFVLCILYDFTTDAPE